MALRAPSRLRRPASIGILVIGVLLAVMNVMVVETPTAFPALKVIKFVVNKKYRQYLLRLDARVKHLSNPEREKFRVGDRVRLKMPMEVNNRGRGYFNEGRAKYLRHDERNHEEEIQDAAERERFIDGGAEGWVAYYNRQYFDWVNKPFPFKGKPRPLPIVSFDDPTVPICAVEESNLELLDRSFAEAKAAHARYVRQQTRLDNEFLDPQRDLLYFKPEGGEVPPLVTGMPPAKKF